jgi:hypothetical protein
MQVLVSAAPSFKVSVAPSFEALIRPDFVGPPSPAKRENGRSPLRSAIDFAYAPPV